MPATPVQVYIVDDEATICTAYARLMRSARMHARTFTSVEDFLHSEIRDEGACVICDLQMPGIGGLDLPALLAQGGHHIPVIFVTAHDTAESREMAQRTGAAGYFRKPVDDQALLDAITWAVRQERAP